MNLRLGQPAPDFCLPDQNNQDHCLANYLGQPLILYFYPKDATPGCTIEACSFRDNFDQFQALTIPVLGISTDSVVSHYKFAQKHKLNFPLLADTQKQVVKLYGVYGPKKFMGRVYQGIIRTTFVLDAQGRIARIYPQVKPENHVHQLLTDLQSQT